MDMHLLFPDSQPLQFYSRLAPLFSVTPILLGARMERGGGVGVPPLCPQAKEAIYLKYIFRLIIQST